jgi:hypothetical protein
MRLEKSFGGMTNSRNVLFLQIFPKRAAKPSAGNPLESVNLTWPSTKDSQNFFRDLLCNLLREPVLHLTWLYTKLSHFSGTFFGTLLNLPWLCTKAAQTIFGIFTGTR